MNIGDFQNTSVFGTCSRCSKGRMEHLEHFDFFAVFQKTRVNTAQNTRNT